MTADPAEDLGALLELAQQLADAADAISMSRFGALDLRVQAKPDLTPVSDADLAVERAIRDLLGARRPQDTIIGEEFGSVGSVGTAADPVHRVATAGGVSWVVDPIDGTKNYVRGVPVWATLIAVMIDGVPALGVVSAPALARRWWGATGLGSWSKFSGGPPRRSAVSGVGAIADASLSFSELKEWTAVGRGERFAALVEGCWRTRGYGDFYSYMLVAQGAVDIAVEPDLNLWDLAALAPIVTEAGGMFTDVNGEPVRPNSTSALASNGKLHDEVVNSLAPTRHVTLR